MSDKAVTRTLAHDIKLFYLFNPLRLSGSGQDYQLHLVVSCRLPATRWHNRSFHYYIPLREGEMSALVQAYLLSFSPLPKVSAVSVSEIMPFGYLTGYLD